MYVFQQMVVASRMNNKWGTYVISHLNIYSPLFSLRLGTPNLFDLPELPTAWWFLDWEEICYCRESRKQEAKGSRHLHFEEPLLKMSSNEFLKIEAPTTSHFLSSFSKAIMHFHLFFSGLYFFFSVSLNFCFLFMLHLIHSFCWQTCSQNATVKGACRK